MEETTNNANVPATEEKAEDTVIVSQAPSNTQIAVKDTAESVDGIIDEVVGEDNQPAEETQTTEAEDTTPKTEEGTNQQLDTAHKALEDAEKDLVSKGVDFNALEAEYMNNGSLSSESYARLEQAGYPKAVVDGVINGWEAASQRFVNDVFNLAGGQEEYARIQQFVSSQPQAVRDAFNATLDSENLMQIKLTLDGIKGQMVKQYGTQKASIIGRSAPAVDMAGYETTADMIKDMSDPRYQTDPKFTKEVYRKVKNSKLF